MTLSLVVGGEGVVEPDERFPPDSPLGLDNLEILGEIRAVYEKKNEIPVYLAMTRTLLMSVTGLPLKEGS